MAVPKPMLTEFDIHYILESCVLVMKLKISGKIFSIGNFFLVTPRETKYEMVSHHGVAWQPPWRLII